MSDTGFIMTKREKVCLEILKKMIEARGFSEVDAAREMRPIKWSELVSRSVDMTNQMLMELKMKGGQNA